MYVHWELSHEFSIPMDDVLTIDSNVEIVNKFDALNTLYLLKYPRIRIPTQDRLNIVHYNTFRSINDNKRADLTAEFAEAIRTIQINQRLVAIADKIDVSNHIGVHCRRSDYWSLNHETAARTYIKLDRGMRAHLKQQYPNEKFFISSDSPYTTIYFEEQFKGSIKHHPKASYPLWRSRNRQCIEEGIVDHILLSRCKKIVADSTSTFSKTAAWMGGIEKEHWEPPK